MHCVDVYRLVSVAFCFTSAAPASDRLGIRTPTGPRDGRHASLAVVSVSAVLYASSDETFGNSCCCCYFLTNAQPAQRSTGVATWFFIVIFRLNQEMSGAVMQWCSFCTGLIIICCFPFHLSLLYNKNFYRQERYTRFLMFKYFFPDVHSWNERS